MLLICIGIYCKLTKGRVEGSLDTVLLMDFILALVAIISLAT